jgi:tetratricopeptide (TPR) repeat protein
MRFLDSLNQWSQTLLRVRIFNLFKQASQFKIAAQKAEELARDKHLKEAVGIVEKTLNLWSSPPSFWERLMRRWLLGNLVKQLQGQLAQWQSQLLEADKLVYEANTLRERSSDPLETRTLSRAIGLYQRYTEIVFEESVLAAIDQCRKEIGQRQQFRALITAAEAEVQQKFFKSAIALYYQAQQLYSTEAVTRAIDIYSAQFRHEKIYEAALNLAQQGFKDGRLQWAATLLESALANFTRFDGIDLLEQIKLALRGKQKFRQGLKAEQLGSLNEAASMYAEAKELLDDPTECLLRLGVVAIKTQEWAKSQAYLKGLSGEQAAYLRGFAYTNEGNLQQAHREWQPLTQTSMETQRHVLKSLAQRQRLLLLKNIEQLVKHENWQDAQAASNAFIEKFGCDPVVEGNLEAHIQPRIAATVWENPHWQTAIERVEKVWLEQPNFTSLHNWAIATYYYAIAQPLQRI